MARVKGKKDLGVDVWKRLLSEQIESGKTVTDFCDDKKLSASTFYRYKSRLDNKNNVDNHTNIKKTTPKSKHKLVNTETQTTVMSVNPNNVPNNNASVFVKTGNMEIEFRNGVYKALVMYIMEAVYGKCV